MSYVRTEEEARMNVRALLRYLLEEDPDFAFGEERVLVMIKEAYANGRHDIIHRDKYRYNGIDQNDFRKIPT